MDELLIETRANDNDIDTDYYYEKYLMEQQDQYQQREELKALEEQHD